ncbi:MAG TPA: peptide deformylase [Verrucomicrobiae bacterium]|nr:peptide deformylase [Verrucomicrobiae bacterium]
METLELLPTEAKSLRERSRELDVAEVTKPEFQEYLDALIVKMHQANGVGLASPQIGKNIRCVVIQPDPYKTPEILINPVITKKSEALLESEEGCLSVPGVYGLVKRHKKISVQALNRHGRRIEFEAKNFDAFVIQHEIDHLDGILFVDKADRKVKVDADGHVKRVR